MAKANITLPNGTTVNVEGTTEEVERLLLIYSGAQPPPDRNKAKNRGSTKRKKRPVERGEKPAAAPSIDIIELVNLIRTCDESDAIERHILDKTSELNRVLLPLYVVHEYKDNKFGLTSGDIEKVTTQLGVRVSTGNASTSLSNDAKSYVLGDTVRVRGQPVRYKLHRRGIQYMKKILSSGSTAKQEE
jgi:hypothetical protein